MLTICHFVRDLDRSSGGPAFSVPSLCGALSDLPDTRVELFAKNSRNPQLPGERAKFRCHLIEGNRRQKIRDALEQLPNQASVVHVNGLWDPFIHHAVTEARLREIPVAISARGMLEFSALAHRRWKKTVGWHLYQKRDLLSASVIHGTSQSEIDSIRRLGLNNPVCLIPNGISIADQTLSDHRKAPVVLFLGRLHPIKGLDNLFEAWSRTIRPGWTLQVSGPDENGYSKHLHGLASKLGIADSVIFTGPLSGETKWHALTRASALVLPSRSENFGMVVAEALSAGTAVAASTGTPWSELSTDGAGWWCSPDPESLSEVINQIQGMPQEELVKMGQRGRELVKRNYSWPALISRYEKVYRWLAGETTQPEDIFTVPSQ